MGRRVVLGSRDTIRVGARGCDRVDISSVICTLNVCSKYYHAIFGVIVISDLSLL